MYYNEQKTTTESSTKDKIGKKIVDTTVKKLDNWVYNELEKLKFGEFPVCLEFDEKTLYIGGLFIKTIQKNMYQVYDKEKTIHIFYSKYASVLFTLLTHLRYSKMASNILEKDKQVAKNYDDIQYYQLLQTRLLKNKKTDEIVIIDNKLHEAKCRYKINMEELEKNIAYAKYMKVWEKLK
jgi:hypothetical protein